jgi:Zn-finger nucleic acid-binding protein
MPFTASCPSCHQSLQVPDAAAGKRGKCPACGHVWTIARPTVQVPPFNAPCPACQNSLQVPGSAVGKRAKCPACQHVWVIPQPIVAAVVAEKPKTWFDEALDEVHPAQFSQATATNAAAESRPAESVKMWRDGKFLVVDINACEFPAYCVKTGKPTTTRHRIELAWVDQSKTWGASIWSAFGPLGKAKALREIENMKTKFSLRVGLSPEWLARRQIKRCISWAVIAAGVMVGLIGGAMGAWTVQYVPSPGKPPVRVSMAFIAGGVIFAIGWLMLDYTRDRSVLGLQTMDDRHAWLVGVHKDLLERLEPWK